MRNREANRENYRWAILAAATFAQICACLFIQGIGAISVFIQEDLSLSGTQVGMLMSAIQLVPVVGLVVAGELLDKFKEPVVIAGGALILALGLFGASLATSFTSLVIFLLIVGAGYSTAQPGGSKSVAVWFPTDQRGLALGIRQSGIPLGGAIAAGLLPSLSLIWGWQAAALAGALFSLLGATIFVVFYRAPHTKKDQSADEGKQEVNSSQRVISALATRVSMLRERAIIKIMVSGVALISVQTGIIVFFVHYLNEETSLAIHESLLALIVAQAAGILGRITLAAWSDKTRQSRSFSITICILGVSTGLISLTFATLAPFPVILIMAAWLGYFGFGWYGPWVTYITEVAPPEKTGFVLGAAMSVNQVAVIVSAPMFGAVRDITGSYLFGWIALAVLCIVTATVTLIYRRSSKTPSS